ncbi:outer membrane receptor protein involved in Fe transport [Sinobacterium caligoides]|uniref:Outer membrane receptor protein involved in Fe transport n=1 Tax=Sinobacterium caligoides TaxID=933926 RepID=A0A3N2E0L1_9GAMM|nr:TonB-dependent receptor [Sinobacterium caligoides]ROS05650.1 outer membrane receptor protein involved in Fe transport [Sinobacterium caligoides]
MTRSICQRKLPPHLRPSTLAISIALASTLTTPVAFAEKGEGFALEEVVVTARKTEESMQEVPVTVSAFSGEALKSLGIDSVKDLEGVVPGLNMGGGGNGTKGESNPYIRGMGQRETKVTVDSAVGTYIDGIYSSRAPGALLDAADIASMQVLRGPQGTLFGKNTTGGAIVITTKKPHEEFGGHVETTLGNFGRQNVSGTLNVPLVDDKLLSRFTLAQTKNDGYMENLEDGTLLNDDDRQMAMGQLRWEVSDTLRADLLLAATKTRQKSRGQRCSFYGEELAEKGYGISAVELIYNANSSTSSQEHCEEGGGDLDTDQFRSELNNESGIFRQSIYEVDTKMVGLTFDWDLSEYSDYNLGFKSITGFRQVEQKADEDLDGSAAALIGRVQPIANQTNQYTQEFQFSGSAMDDRLRGTLGLFASLEETDDDWLQSYVSYIDNTNTIDPTKFETVLAQSDLTERETKNTAWAVFSQVSFDMTELSEITFGLRYTEEERETTYHEGNVYLPSIGNGSYCPSGGCSNYISIQNTIHPFSAAGNTPMTQWQYGYDANRNGNLEDREIGLFGESSQSRTDSAWSPSLSVKMRASDSILETLYLDEGMMFATVSKGFRSGGVVVGNTTNDSTGMKDMGQFEPENVMNYELGVKADAFDGMVRANMAMYYTDYSDIQVTTVIPDNLGIPLPAVENAGQAIIQGVEGEFTIIPHELMRLTASFAYTDADYKEYLVDFKDPVLGTVQIDRADEPMPRVAEWTGFLAADFFIYTESFGTIIPSLITRYTSEIYHGFDRESFIVQEHITSDAATFFDARLTWQLPDERTTMTLWGQNLTNVDDYLVGGVPLVGVSRTSGSVYGEPRTFGIDLSYNFE